MNNKKKLIIGIVLGIILISGITYAILTWTSTRINLGITSDCFTIDYTKGGDITGSLKLLNEEDLITSDNKFTIKNGVGISSANIGINSSCNIEGYGSLYLNVTSISDAFTTGDSVGALKYAVLKNTSSITNPREVSVASLLDQSFDIEATGSITSSGTKDILVRNLSNTEIYKYLIVIYIDNNLASNDVIGATFTGNISADANQGKMLSPSEKTLQALNLSLSSGTPDFSKTSEEDGTNGIYASEDDLGTSYYFRGAVENNYISFAGFYWRIIRINGDGTVRMIYAGTSPHENGYNDSSTHDMRIDESAYNDNYEDNAYVGYMYGPAGSSTYDETHSNTNDSTIKTLVDDWYQNNLVSYEQYIADAIYCNDRSVTSGTGIGTTDTEYANTTRLYSYNPTFKCTNTNDKFTKSTTIGNGKLTNPIGLITSDEVVYAGENYRGNNTSYYLYNGDWYWTMTPAEFAGGGACVDDVRNGGYLDFNDVYNVIGARPVVSLNSDAISGGRGTMTDPFVVG